MSNITAVTESLNNSCESLLHLCLDKRIRLPPVGQVPHTQRNRTGNSSLMNDQMCCMMQTGRTQSYYFYFQMTVRDVPNVWLLWIADRFHTHTLKTRFVQIIHCTWRYNSIQYGIETPLLFLLFSVSSRKTDTISPLS